MADIIITPLAGKIDFFTNKGDNTPINGVKLVGSNLVFYGPISASSILTNGGGRYVTTTSPTINYVPKFNSNSSIANSLIFDSGTNVGIGTNKPSASLHVISSTSGTTLLRADGTSGTLFSVIDDLTDSLMSVNNSAGLPVFEVFADDRIVAGQYGTNDFVITNNEVGIGTNNPLAKLHVTGSSTVPAAIFLGNIGIGTTSFVYSNTNRADVEIYGTTDALLALRNATANSYIHKTGNDFYINNGGAGNLVLQNNGSERMRINSSGNVGIGTSSPSHLLTLSRATQTTAYQLNFNTDGGITDGNYTGIRFSQGAGGGTELGNIRLTYFTTGATALSLGVRNSAQAVYIGTDGNVGISNINPTSKLYVEGGSANWSLPNPGTSVGTIHLDPGSTTDNFGNAITFGASDSANGETAQAGIYVRSDGGYGTVIYLATTDDYNVGSKVRFTVGNNGNIGIATTAPAYKLDVNGTFNVSGTSTLAAVSVSGLISSNVTEAIRINNNNGYISFYNTAGNTRTGYLQGNAGNSVTLAAENSSAILFAVGGSEVARISTAGNVGIGTTNPVAKLHITGSSTAAVFYGNVGIGTSTFSYPTANRGLLEIFGSTDALIALRSSGTNFYIHKVGVDCYIVNTNSGFISIYNNGSERMRIASDGNIGIGTTSPSRKLDISGSAIRSFSAGGGGEPGFIVDYPSSNGYGAFFIHVNGTRRWRIGSVGDTNVQPALNFWQEGTGSRMIINNLGNVGVGTSSPVGNLDVYTSAGSSHYVRSSVSAIRLLAYGDGSNWIQSGTSAGASSADLIFSSMSGGTQWMRIQGSSGNVGIGTTSPGAKLAIIGTRLTDPNNDAQSREIYYAVSRTVAAAAGSTTLLGYLTPTNRSDNAVIEIYHHDCGTIEYIRFVMNSAYYSGATTDWVQLPTISNISYSGNFNGCTVDARLASTNANIELRLRSIGGACADMAVFVSIKTNCLFTSQTTTGTGGTVSGILCNNGYDFPVGANRFEGTRNRGLYIINSGNVGINTQSPSAMLHVSGSTAGDEVFVGTISDNQIVGGRTGGSFGIATKSASNGNLILTANAGMFLRTGGSNDRVFIKSDGNVGIGTTSPGSKFEMYGGNMTIKMTGVTTGSIHFKNSSNIKIQEIRYDDSDGSLTLGGIGSYPIKFITSTTEKVRIAGDGNVGINTTSPSALLNIRASSPTTTGTVPTGTNVLIDSNTSNYLTFRNTGDNGTYAGLIFLDNNIGGYIVFRNYTTDGVVAGSDSMIYGTFQDHIFQNGYVNETLYNRTETMRIKANGNVGIGTNSPSHKLHLSGSMLITGIGSGFSTPASEAGYRLKFYDNGGVNNDTGIGLDGSGLGSEVIWFNAIQGFYWNFGTNGEKMRLTSAGNLGIGTSVPSTKLTVIATNDTGSRIQLGTNSNSAFMDANKVNDFMVLTAPFGASPAGVSNGGAKWGIKMNGSIDNINTKAKSAAIYAVSEENSAGYNRQVGLALHTSGFDLENAERVRIKNDGNVGINTTSPSAKLHVVGSSILNGTTYIYGEFNVVSSNSYNTHFNIGDTGTNYITTANNGITHFRGSTNGIYGMFVSGSGHVQTNYKTTLAVLSGNVGIGTTSPSAKLEVGNFLDAVTNKIIVSARYEYQPEFNFRLGQSGTNLDWIGAVISSGDDGNYNGLINFKTANAGRDTPTTKMVIKANGNVGIGTTSPSGKLDVNGVSNFRDSLNINKNITTNNWGLTIENTNTGGWGVSQYFRLYGYNSTPAASFDVLQIVASYPGYGQVDFLVKSQAQSTASTVMSLLGNGSVGIGTTSPAYKLDVNGILGISGTFFADKSSNYFRILEPAGNIALYLGNASDPTNYYDNTGHTFRNRGGSSVYAYINSNGNLGIGTTSVDRKLKVIGEIGLYVNGSNSLVPHVYITNASNSRSYNIQQNAVGSNLALWGYNSSNAWQNLVNFNYNGNVGIGTSSPSGSLHAVSSAAGATLLRADGTSGTLFSVIDDLTDSLMSVNNSAGLPVFEVFADDRIVAGQYGVNDFVLTNNKIGIGTNNPVAKLHVTGSTAVPAAVFLGDVGIGTTAPTSQTNYRFLQVNGPVSAIIEANVGGTRIGGFDSTSNVLYVGSIGSFPVVFRTAVDEKMRITANGNIGIGTSSPNGKLTIVGDGSQNGYSGVVRISDTAGPKWAGIGLPDVQSTTTAANNYYLIGRAGAYTDRILSIHIPNAADYGSGAQPKFGVYSTGSDLLASVEASTGTSYFKGNVGIGTTTMPSPLTVYNNSDVWHFRLGGASGELRMGGQTNSGAVIQAYTPGGTVRDLYVQRDGGNVGIGTNSPIAKLDVVGSVKVSAKLIQNSTTVSVSGTGQTLTLNLDTAAVYVVSMASGATITTISYSNRDNNPSVNTIMLVVKYAGTASITFTNVIWANGVPPTLTGTNAFADVFMLTSYQGGAGTPVWIGTVVAQALVSTNL